MCDSRKTRNCKLPNYKNRKLVKGIYFLLLYVNDSFWHVWCMLCSQPNNKVLPQFSPFRNIDNTETWRQIHWVNAPTLRRTVFNEIYGSWMHTKVPLTWEMVMIPKMRNLSIVVALNCWSGKAEVNKLFIKHFER